MRLFNSSKNKNYVGLELGRQFVRLLVLQNTSSGLIPTLHDEVSIIPNQDNSIPWSELREALAILMDRNQIDKAHVTIPQCDALIFEDRILGGERIEDVVYRNIDLAPQELQYDVIERGGLVTVFAIHKNVFSDYIKLLSDFNITPLSMQTENQAIARTVTNVDDQSSLVAVHISSHRTVVTVSKDGLPYFSKTILHEPIESFDSENEDAKVWRKLISRAIYHVYEKEGSIQQYKEKNIYISGDVSRPKIQRAINFLSSAIGNANFASTPVWQHCFSLEDYIPNIFYEDSLRYANVIGAALTDSRI